jgi:hypothetical protein
MRTSSWLLALLFMALSSCNGNAPGERVEYTDEGRLCVYGSQPTPFDQSPQEFVADAPVHVMVTHHGCLSSSCTKDRQSSCTIAVQGAVITVSSQGGYTDTSASSAACTDDCAMVSGTCATAALPAGTYTLSHGGDSLTLDIPSSVAMPPCVGQSD